MQTPPAPQLADEQEEQLRSDSTRKAESTPLPASPILSATVPNPTTEDSDNEEGEDSKSQDAESIKQTPHDSMVTVRLSEPPPLPDLHIDTNIVLPALQRRESSTSTTVASEQGEGDETPSAEVEDSPRITMMDVNGEVVASPSGSESLGSQGRRASASSEEEDEGDDEEVNWEELEKTEEQEPRDQGSDDVSSRWLVINLNEIHANTPHSQRHSSSPASNKKTTCWSRILSLELQRCKLRRGARRANRDRRRCNI